jgi:hypothetical protein
MIFTELKVLEECVMASVCIATLDNIWLVGVLITCCCCIMLLLWSNASYLAGILLLLVEKEKLILLHFDDCLNLRQLEVLYKGLCAAC